MPGFRFGSLFGTGKSSRSNGFGPAATSSGASLELAPVGVQAIIFE
jgi:hypothetical protein